MAGKIIADTIEASGSQISLNVGNVTVLTASSTGLTLTPTSNVNINVTNSTLAFGAGNVSFPSITASGDTNTGLYFPAADTIGFVEGGAEAMRIDSSGRVGIGTSNVPSNKDTVTPKFIVNGAGVAGSMQVVRNTTVGGGGGILELTATRGTDVNSYTILQSGDGVGSIVFGGADGTQFTPAAQITASVDGTPGANDMPGRLIFSTTADGASSTTERMRIDSTGRVMINTTTADARLSVHTDGTNTALGYGLALVNDAGGGNTWTLQCGQYAVNNGKFTIYDKTNNKYPLLIDALNMYVTMPGVYALTSGSAANVFVATDGTLYRSTSSLKYKTNVQNATHGLAELLTLRPVTYKGKNDGDKVFGGLIAEEVHEAGLTEFVEYAEDGTPDALAYSNMVSLCIKSIQELKVIVDTQAVEIAALKAK